MGGVISIITAVFDGGHRYLKETYKSLADQELPDGWTWQWVVQEDGDSGRPIAELPSDQRISSALGRRGCAATARNLALARAEGVLVRALDADDVLLPGALMRDIAALIEHPDIAWCVSPAVDLLPDGTLRPGPRDPDPGPMPPSFLADGERRGFLQVLGTTLCTYAELVRALGGWPALTQAEDAGLLLAAEAVSSGWMLDKPGLLYRRWDGQTTAGRDPADKAKDSPQRDAIQAQIDALGATGWRWTPRQPVAAATHRP
jgi:hypothetical protein